MKPNRDAIIIDVTENINHERLLYRCLAPMPYRKYQNRRSYLEKAIPQGFRKKVLFLNSDPIGQIEYAPAESSGYPIFGEAFIVLHCFWVLRRAKGNRLGTLLIDEMLKEHPNATGFATIGLADHWSPWLKKSHMELFGFMSIDSFTVSHLTKHVDECFTIHLMWRPHQSKKHPEWDKESLLQGVKFCMAHPLYHPQNVKKRNILQECKS